MNDKNYYHFNIWDAVVFLTVFCTIASVIKKWIETKNSKTETIIIKTDNENARRK